MYKIKIFLTTVTFILSMFVAWAQTPGGSSAVTFNTWLTPDSYSNGIWTNRVTNGTGNFIQPANWTSKVAPSVQTGTNFHPAVLFRPNSYAIALNRLQSENGINLTTNDAFTIILVYKAKNAGFFYQNIMNFAAPNEYLLNNYSLGYYTDNNPQLSMGWPTTRRALGNVPFDATALVTIDNNNGQGGTANGILQYVNGVQIASATTAAGSVNNPVMLGSSNYYPLLDGERGVNADIQEVIILKRPKANYRYMTDVNAGNDLKKIHTYLAIKYGISLNSFDYTATDGTVVWSNTANAGYNNHIFGIGRDNATDLYQKQSSCVSNSQITLFLGSRLETLNSQNTATMGDKQFLIIGSDGQPAVSSANIADGSVYENGSIDAPGNLNFQSGIYKAQLTGMTSITVNLKVKTDYSYVFVSPDANFTPAKTKIYRINSSKTATIDIDATHNYIRFAGYDAGPGGVNAALRLWLRADDEGALTLENLPITDQKLDGFPTSNSIEPAVQEWKDQIRNKTYSWAQGNSEIIHRIPVYEPNNLMMNFHPSVHFWGTNIYGSYLSTTSAITTAAQPAAHTAYFVTSNDFNTNRWFYTMMFGSATSNINYDGPGYGVDRVTSGSVTNYVGRLRTTGGEADGTLNLFTVGATSILGYYQNGQNIKFRFNGKEDSRTFSWGAFNMTAPSMIGKGYTYDRTVIGVMSEVIIFERELNAGEQRRLESYLAIKYGATLRPANTATNRFDYTLSDGTVFWRGDATASDPVFGKYATFYNNIAAVIRDDAAKLHNVQSHSTDAGSILHMGVAGTKLGKNFDVGELPVDLEAIAWGSNSEAGILAITNADPCADFTGIFKKKWMVHKLTANPVAMLVGAEDNTNNVLGSSVAQDIKDMYGKLGIDNEISLIVADSPEKLDPNNPAYGDFKAIVPMKYREGEQQCIYTFSDSIVYVTFGYKASRNQGCYSTFPAFNPKTYNWNTQWTRRNYNLNGVGVKNIPTTPVVEDLGENVTVTTKMEYANGVRSDANYPRFTSSPRNSLEIQRRDGTSDNASKVTTTITFSTPVSPTFKIYGLDTRNGQRDKVTIRGICPGGIVFPTLKSAGGNNPTYKISGNTATVSQNRSVSATDVNGTIDVSFASSGVQEIIIEYNIVRTTNSSGAQDIFIGPITINNVPNAPVINEDGLGLTKWTGTNEISTCESMEYRFEVVNTNIVEKYVHFTDVLPEGMTWVAGTVGLDTTNTENSSINVNSYAGTRLLDIDSLLVPCTGRAFFTAIARPDRNAPSDIYRNRARIVYQKITNNISTLVPWDSYNADGQADSTAININLVMRKDNVTLRTISSPSLYAANREILVTLELTNPNSDVVSDMFLDLSWDAGFRYVANSWSSTTGGVVVPGASNSMTLSIAGNASGTPGFTLPGNSTKIFSFKLLAPDAAHLEHELDALGQPTKDIVPLNVFYEFSSEMDNPCVLESLNDLSGILRMPYGSKNFIITNKHITTKISN